MNKNDPVPSTQSIDIFPIVYLKVLDSNEMHLCNNNYYTFQIHHPLERVRPLQLGLYFND